MAEPNPTAPAPVSTPPDKGELFAGVAAHLAAAPTPPAEPGRGTPDQEALRRAD
jgi:hypothetical protein